MSRTAIIDIKCDGNSFAVDISEYSSEDGRLLEKKTIGTEEEIKQIRLKGKVILTTSIYSYKLSIVLEDLNNIAVKEGTLIID